MYCWPLGDLEWIRGGRCEGSRQARGWQSRGGGLSTAGARAPGVGGYLLAAVPWALATSSDGWGTAGQCRPRRRREDLETMGTFHRPLVGMGPLERDMGVYLSSFPRQALTAPPKGPQGQGREWHSYASRQSSDRFVCGGPVMHAVGGPVPSSDHGRAEDPARP